MKKIFKKILVAKKYGVNKLSLNKIFKYTRTNNRFYFINPKLKHFRFLNYYLRKKMFLKDNKEFRKHFKNYVRRNIKFQVELKSFKGKRFIYRYPVRGQRTHTNAKTSRKFRY